MLNLVGTEFVNFKFEDEKFFAPMKEVKNVTFKNCTFKAIKDWKQFIGCKFINCIFEGATLQHCTFKDECTLEKCNFKDADMKGFHFAYDVTIKECNFDNADLEEASIIDTKVENCSFKNCNVNKIFFKYVEGKGHDVPAEMKEANNFDKMKVVVW